MGYGNHLRRALCVFAILCVSGDLSFAASDVIASDAPARQAIGASLHSDTVAFLPSANPRTWFRPLVLPIACRAVDKYCRYNYECCSKICGVNRASFDDDKKRCIPDEPE
jgi:hypothetical protein